MNSWRYWIWNAVSLMVRSFERMGFHQSLGVSDHGVLQGCPSHRGAGGPPAGPCYSVSSRDCLACLGAASRQRQETQISASWWSRFFQLPLRVHEAGLHVLVDQVALALDCASVFFDLLQLLQLVDAFAGLAGRRRARPRPVGFCIRASPAASSACPGELPIGVPSARRPPSRIVLQLLAARHPAGRASGSCCGGTRGPTRRAARPRSVLLDALSCVPGAANAPS
jgi:hypothetical protein